MLLESLYGLGVGLALGMTGGGGVLAVPALVLGLGYSLPEANCAPAPCMSPGIRRRIWRSRSKNAWPMNARSERRAGVDPKWPVAMGENRGGSERERYWSTDTFNPPRANSDPTFSPALFGCHQLWFMGGPAST
jgi:hypothetical protein